MRTHISKTVSSCFAVLRQLRSIRRSVSPAVLQSLVASLVLSRLDYGKATLYGLPGNQIDRMQSVMNAAARQVFSARKYEHVTPLLRDLHWLRVSDQIEFKLSVLVFRCLDGIAPAYLSDELHRVPDSGTRRRLRSTSSPALVVPPMRRTTIGDRSFPVAGARVWNALPSFVTNSTISFKHHFKTYLFARSRS